MAALIKTGLDPRTVSQWTSLVGALLTVLVVGWWGMRRWGLFWGTLAALAVAFHPNVGTWARGGLETTMFTMFVVLILVAAAEGRWRLAAVAAGLLAITRPEGLMYALAFLAFTALILRRESRFWREFPAVASLTVSFSLVWLLFRLAYFGDWLPNTYYAKMDGVRTAQLERGFDYLVSFIESSMIVVPLVLIMLAGLVGFIRWRVRPGEEPLQAWVLRGCELKLPL